MSAGTSTTMNLHPATVELLRELSRVHNAVEAARASLTRAGEEIAHAGLAACAAIEAVHPGLTESVLSGMRSGIDLDIAKARARALARVSIALEGIDRELAVVAGSCVEETRMVVQHTRAVRDAIKEELGVDIS